MGIVPSCSSVTTIVWSHYLDFNEIPGEKAIWGLHKNPAYRFEQIQREASSKKEAVTAIYLLSDKYLK